MNRRRVEPVWDYSSNAVVRCVITTRLALLREPDMTGAMPDWFYRTVAQRALFCLPDRTGRAIALGTIGALGKSSAGRALIEFMGHMKAEPNLAVHVGGIEFTSPVGLGWRVDPERRATRGLACFGVGCIEIWTGPPRLVGRTRTDELEDEAAREQKSSAPPPGRGTTPLLLRCLDARGRETVELPNGVVLPVVDTGEIPAATSEYESGVLLQAGTRLPAGGWRVPTSCPDELRERVRAWRKVLSAGAVLIVAGGVGDPRDALSLREAGANLMLVDAGLVFKGSGLVKRCNEALARESRKSVESEAAPRLFRSAWFWAGALGTAMAAGGAMTLALATTRVLLPYDEHYVGLTADTLRRTSPRLFAFMAHDRGTLAGTMLGLGWVYLVLAWHGVRRGRHGARTTVVASALAGFASFFAFFGFGYFDTLHAFVAVVLFQLTVQIMVGGEKRDALRPIVDDEDAAWRRAQWGQLMWVVHAVGLLIAGGVILAIGMTSVFVSEDLNFLCMTPAEAQTLGAKLIGVVAHDRATLGGMLLASGVAMLLPVLWCFRRGEHWLWWAMTGLGAPAYAAALGMHYQVAYTDWRHIAPALTGLALWLGGVLFTRGYLRRRDDAVSKPAI